MKNYMVAILIPIYKKKLNNYERISLEQCKKVFNNIPIYFIAPNGLIIQDDKSNCRYEYFDKKFFESTLTYNKLMMSVELYERFINYEYILIYQLDAFVFSNRLDTFVSKEYDYIGAPWLSGITIYKYYFSGVRFIHKWFPFLKIGRTVYVGNGGVSLRKVEKHIEILREKKKFLSKWNGNEDLFWAYIGEFYPNKFKVAPLDVALKFAFEQNPKLCFKRNNEKIPFTCHAWEKWDIDFWRKIFEEYGYNI